MKKVNPSPDLIVLPGDFVTHSIPQKNGTFGIDKYIELKNTIANHSATVAKMFPETPMIFSQGNDDYPINYNVPNKTMKHDYYKSLYSYFVENIKANKFAVIFKYIIEHS